MAEVFRAGIQAIPKGQWEAGLSVGMSRRLLLRRIILPQAIRIVVPAIGNFFVSIFKDSALVSVITMRDLMFSGQILAAATYKHFEIFTEVAVIYFIISYPTAKFVEWIEAQARRLQAQDSDDRGETFRLPGLRRDARPRRISSSCPRLMPLSASEFAAERRLVVPLAQPQPAPGSRPRGS